MIIWSDLDGFGFTWGELGQMELTWGDLEQMSLEELSAVATQKLERFRQSNQPDKVEDPKVVIQIENLYVTVEQHFPEVVPHKDRLSKKALDMFFSGVIGLAISQIYEHRDEIAEILRKVILVLIEITHFQ